MDQRDRRKLVDAALLSPGGVWADLGAGTGAFSLCLASVLGAGATLWAVDRDAAALEALRRTAAQGGPGLARLELLVADFLASPGLPPLDGVLMANSLHYAGPIEAALGRIVPALKPGGRLLVVEYDTDRANPWVPDPVPFSRLVAAAAASGLSTPRLLERVRSRYHGHVYSALAFRLEPPGTA